MYQQSTGHIRIRKMPKILDVIEGRFCSKMSSEEYETTEMQFTPRNECCAFALV